MKTGEIWNTGRYDVCWYFSCWIGRAGHSCTLQFFFPMFRFSQCYSSPLWTDFSTTSEDIDNQEGTQAITFLGDLPIVKNLIWLWIFLTQDHMGLQTFLFLPVLIQFQVNLMRALMTIGEYRPLCFFETCQILQMLTLRNFNMGINGNPKMWNISRTAVIVEWNRWNLKLMALLDLLVFTQQSYCHGAGVCRP